MGSSLRELRARQRSGHFHDGGFGIWDSTKGVRLALFLSAHELRRISGIFGNRRNPPQIREIWNPSALFCPGPSGGALLGL